MKAKASLSLLIILFSFNFVHALDLNSKQKLVCLPFVAKDMEATSVTDSLSAVLLNHLDRTGYFEILERKKIEAMMELEGLRIDALNRDSIFNIGNRHDLDFLLSCAVSRTGSGIVLEMELLNVKGRRCCLSRTITISEMNASAKLQDVARDIVTAATVCFPALPSTSAEDKPAAPPHDIKITSTSSSIKLKWAPSDSDGIMCYKVFRASSESGPFLEVAATKNAVYTDLNLRRNELFYYKIKAIHRKGK